LRKEQSDRGYCGNSALADPFTGTGKAVQYLAPTHRHEGYLQRHRHDGWCYPAEFQQENRAGELVHIDPAQQVPEAKAGHEQLERNNYAPLKRARR
jgi:hypothetical protein